MKSLIGFLVALPLAAQTIGVVPTVYKVSQLIPAAHAVSGCNPVTGLRTGGSACYNDVSYINQATALGVAGHPVDIIFDVSIGIAGCITWPANGAVTFEGINGGTSGVFVLSGSNATAFSVTFPGMAAGTCLTLFDLQTPGSQAGEVAFRDLYVNGNRGVYPNGNCNNGDVRCGGNSGPWATCIQLGNLLYAEVLNVHLQDCPAYAIYGSNVARYVARGNTVVSPTLGTNTDGVHMSGLIGSCDISNNYFKVGDDGVALNGPEGYPGPIGPCTVSNNTYESVISFMRLYAGTSTYTIGPVVANNLVGTYADDNALPSTVFRLGNNGPGVVDAINLIASNIDATGPQSPIEVTEDVGNLSITNFRWTPTAVKPLIHLTANALVSNFTCTQCSIYRSTLGNSAGYWGQIASGSTIKRHECTGCSVVNEQGQSYGAISYGWDVQSGGAITNLIPGYDPTLMTALLNGNQWSRVASTVGVQTNCGTTSTCSTANVSSQGGYGKSVIGSAPLVTGTPSTVTISGFPVAFTSTASFICTVTDQTAAANNLLKVVNTSTSSITITGPVAITDVIGYSCSGN